MVNIDEYCDPKVADDVKTLDPEKDGDRFELGMMIKLGQIHPIVVRGLILRKFMRKTLEDKVTPLFDYTYPDPEVSDAS